MALAKELFMKGTATFFMYQTGGGMKTLIMTLVSFIVGLPIFERPLHVRSGKT